MRQRDLGYSEWQGVQELKGETYHLHDGEQLTSDGQRLGFQHCNLISTSINLCIQMYTNVYGTSKNMYFPK